MSYHIYLFRKETKQKEREYKNDDFFDDENNLIAFTQKQFEALKKRLNSYDYSFEHEDDYDLHFAHLEFGEALLTKSGLYFTTDSNFDCIFEVGMTASEFTDTGEFEKYDPQAGGWEEI